MRLVNSLVIGTAGHIDHGKTSLVYALTGIDTDRLKEEKQRGISIDLGFAQMRLPGGSSISFVDVPGHERFVRNMLAGATGIEAVMLIVAANESVMPQTREHFEICRLLGLRHGIVVITKTDLASSEQISLTRMDIQNLVAGTFLADAPVAEVSTVTMFGLEELKRHLFRLAEVETSRNMNGVMRLPIDRAFAAKGFGTVVTGTLLAGSVSVGETLELHPGHLHARVRGLQARHSSVELAQAGQRLAVNLTGIDQHNVKRGYVLAGPGVFAGTRLLDVELHWLDEHAPPAPRELFTLHTGTSETSVKISQFQKGFARLRLLDEVIALPGDRFIIRRPSPGQTVAGGVVVDAFPPKRLNRAKSLLRLNALHDAPLERRIEFLANESPAGLTMAELMRMTGASLTQIQSAITNNGALLLSTDNRMLTGRWLEAKRDNLLQWLSDFHHANPNAVGAPLAAARLGLDATLAALVFKDFNAINVQGETVALANHQAKFSARDAAALKKLENAFLAAGFQPPSASEAIAASGIDEKLARFLLTVLVKDDRLVKLPDNLLFHTDVITHIRTSLQQHKGRKFSVADFKSWMNISRKFAIPLLEYLDQHRITRRDGDMRVVL
jgi:selenocysteine-specific elongation factor